MNDGLSYRGYDRAALDLQYNARIAVPEHPEYFARWSARRPRVLETVAHRLDVAYGPSAEETLDIFMPHVMPHGGAPAPVHVFFHGGYWMSRHKDDFAFLAPAFVAAGAVLVIVNYALIPSVDMGELVRQCRAALAWVHGHAADFGGDGGRIFVSGHSAGGHVAAMTMATDWPAFAGAPVDLVKGGCAISGLYDLAFVPLCYLNDTLHLDAGDIRACSPMGLPPANGESPVVFAYGGDESDEFGRQSTDMAAAWSARGAPTTVMACPGLNHFSILEALATPASPLNRAVLAQMKLG